LRQRAGAEDAGVTIEFLDLGQLGWKQAASGVKERSSPGLIDLSLGQELLGVEHFIAARLAHIALEAFVKAEGEVAAHAIQLMGPTAGVKDGLADPLALGNCISRGGSATGARTSSGRG